MFNIKKLQFSIKIYLDENFVIYLFLQNLKFNRHLNFQSIICDNYWHTFS